ncbi:MAG: RagB/SusD family nutrient uptake outer membrane protein [Bacteroidota bacterium]|nr:RagB/SusD family nutrient uptake outer membrane protein [Bacteroidota bacterium]
MRYNKYYFLLLLTIIVGTTACKKQLDVKNPNSPSVEDLLTEPGVTALAKGAVYQNGLNLAFNAGLNQLGSGFSYTVYGYQELLADNISASASNQNINVINLPDYVTLDDGTKRSSGISQRNTIRSTNDRAKRSSNSIYYEWAYMYAMNEACNNILNILPRVKFYAGDSVSKARTVEAWCYFWKGYAYSRIGSMYYAGIINDASYNSFAQGQTNNHYVTHEAMIVEANKNLDKAMTALSGITTSADYSSILSQIIPDFIGANGLHGGTPSILGFQHSINTMKARNILANKLVTAMTVADWNNILTLTANGLTNSDKAFTVQTTDDNNVLSPTGNLAYLSRTTAGTFKISERLTQEYKAGDKRFANNFSTRATTYIDATGGITTNSRYALRNGGAGIAGTITYLNSTAGFQEIYVGPSYEENALMRAEALIYTGKADAGLALVDAVRNYQGAGLVAASGTGLTQAQAVTELRRERRVALFLRGTAFYDYRRWGIIYDVSKGGGRSGAVVISQSSTGAIVVNTNAFINYNFLDYWDVPADESDVNVPDATSAPVINPG